MKQQLIATIRRGRDSNWLLTFPEIPGAHTYGRSLSQLRRRIPELLRLWDRDPARVHVVEVLELPVTIKRAIAQTTSQRRELEARSRPVQRELGRTIESLQNRLSLGVRDTGELLGISPQYVHKLRQTSSARVRGLQRSGARLNRLRQPVHRSRQS